MRAVKWTIGMVLLGAGGVHLAAREDDAFDLRGPAPKKGEITIAKSVFKIENADLTIRANGVATELKQSLTATEEEEIKVLAVEGRQATKVQTKMLKEIVEVNGLEEAKPGGLDKEVIISERSKDGKWKHSLVDSTPNDKQKKELAKHVRPGKPGRSLSRGESEVGHTWTVDASAPSHASSAARSPT